MGQKCATDRRNTFIALDKYGRFPFEALPRSYKAAVTKFGKVKLDANGLLPWQIGVYSEKLTNALKAGKWDEARVDAAILAHYVAQAHDPFSTTDNFDGRLSGQAGINERFGSTLIDRYSSFFPMRPNDAAFISDPTDHAFDACLSAHRWIESILLADRTELLVSLPTGLKRISVPVGSERLMLEIGATLVAATPEDFHQALESAVHSLFAHGNRGWLDVGG